VQALDSFISHIPSFDSDIPISVVLISSEPPGGEAGPFHRSQCRCAENSSRRVKAIANPTTSKKTNKTARKPLGELRLMNLYPQHPRRLPPRPPEKEFQSSDQEGDIISIIFYYQTFINREPPCRLPSDIILDTSTKSAPNGGESPNVDKHPRPRRSL
jgi:hypothetical protein